jgi:hypothetical protein
MRTTLTIDDDILLAARERANFERKTVGEVISSLARKGLCPTESTPVYRNGIRLLPVQPSAGISTPELIKELMDELP